MIARIWHGWTTANADAYERLLRTEIFPGILARKIVGFRDTQLLRRDGVVPPKARAVLSRFDATSQHYEIIEARRN